MFHCSSSHNGAGDHLTVFWSGASSWILYKAPLGHTIFCCMLDFGETHSPKEALRMRFYTKEVKGAWP
jgi:hypothetical protein